MAGRPDDGKETSDRHGRWRVDHRAIRLQTGIEPADDDPLIGLMATPELAARAAASVNRDWLDGIRRPPPDIPRQRGKEGNQ